MGLGCEAAAARADGDLEPVARRRADGGPRRVPEADGRAARRRRAQMLTFLGAYHGMQPSWFGRAGAARSTTTTRARRRAAAAGRRRAAARRRPRRRRGEPRRSTSGRRRRTTVRRALLEAVDAPSSIEGLRRRSASLGFSDNPEKAAAMAQRFLNGLEAALSVDYNCVLREALGRAREALEETRRCGPPSSACWRRSATRTRASTRDCGAGRGGAAGAARRARAVRRHAVQPVGRRARRAAPARRKATPRAKMDCVLRCVLQLKHGCRVARRDGEGRLVRRRRALPDVCTRCSRPTRRASTRTSRV